MQQRIKGYAPRVVTRCYAGEELCVSLQDPLAEGWYDHDWGPQPEIDVLRRGRLRPGARVFDLGAHQAVVALLLSRIVGDDGEVVAVEAELHNARVAEENVQLNRAGNLRIVHAAASDRPGRLFFADSLNGRVVPAGQTGGVEVEAVTIDCLAARYGYPDVVFIDVEGFEANVLAGAQQTLERRLTDFFVEVHDDKTLRAVRSTSDQVVAAFTSHNYSCHMVSATDAGACGEWRVITHGESLGGLRSFLIAVPV